MRAMSTCEVSGAQLIMRTGSSMGAMDQLRVSTIRRKSTRFAFMPPSVGLKTASQGAAAFCSFSESTISDRPARQVARETGARYGGVLYVDSLSDERGPVPTYLKLLEVTVDTIAKGFGQ